MTREELIKKWLDNDLNPEELKAFKAFDDYNSLVKLATEVKRFHAPEYNSEQELTSVLQKIAPKSEPKNTWLKPLLGIAATLALFFAIYSVTSFNSTTIQTLASEKTQIILPDASNASLNALSSISFNKSKWTKKREIQLDGEAFFKVAKGSKFDVVTNDGIVSVLGTEFNVKQRDNVFEVTCFEGLVSVFHNTKTVKLKAGDSYSVINGNIIEREKDIRLTPSWLKNSSYFKSMPYNEVIAEFERQYNVTIKTDAIDSNLLFTGNFTHNNFDLALKSITLPFNLKYRLKSDSIIVLTRE